MQSCHMPRTLRLRSAKSGSPLRMLYPYGAAGKSPDPAVVLDRHADKLTLDDRYRLLPRTRHAVGRLRDENVSPRLQPDLEIAQLIGLESSHCVAFLVEHGDCGLKWLIGA